MGRKATQRPFVSITVDAVVFRVADGRSTPTDAPASLEVLLVERGREPFHGLWALPGGFVRADESLEEAARRELEEETGLPQPYLEQLYTFGEPDRDPRGRVLSVAYFALVPASEGAVHGGSDAARAAWHPASALPDPLAFDHARILEVALKRLRAKVRYSPVGFELLPESFTLTDLQRLYEAILGRTLDKRNFRRKILRTGIVEATGESQRGVAHRAARFYRFARGRYAELVASGFEFAI